MGDLISNSPLVALCGAEIGAKVVTLTGGMYPTVSSNWGAVAPAPRFSLILKSCRSNSNSAMEFFFIKSMMALMSFKSTDPPPVDDQENEDDCWLYSLS